MNSIESDHRSGSHSELLPVIYEEVSEDDRVRNDVWALMDMWAAVRGSILLAGRDEHSMNRAERHALKYWEDKLDARQMEIRWILSGTDDRISYRDFQKSHTTVIEGSFVGQEQPFPEEAGVPAGNQSPFASLAERFFYTALQKIGFLTSEHSLDTKLNL